MAVTTATWLANPGSSDFNTGANWSTGTVPEGAGNGIAVFETSSVTSLTVSGNIFIGGWTFNAGADDFDFTNGAGLFLQFNGSGTDAGIVINGGSASITNDGTLRFNTNASAGDATIVNNSTMQVGSNSGNATTGDATITNNDTINFAFTSSAGNATITTTNGAKTKFSFTSTGGQAAFDTDAGGEVDFSASTGPNNDSKLSAGSIAGAGNYILGANELTTGGNDASTEVSGVISGTGGSLVKTGTGTMTLSGTNTYDGSTTIDEGTLQVDGSIASSNGVTVGNGATLQGSGTTSTVTVDAGATVGPGASAGILSTGAIAFAAASTFAVELGGATPGSGHDQLAVTGSVDLGGATLDLSSIGGFKPDTATPTDFVIIDNDGGDEVTGTFDGLAEGDAFTFEGRFFTITYQGGDGNDVVLTSGGAVPPSSSGSDVIDGSNGATDLADTINGFGGNDVLFGLGGNDTLDGGKNNDKLFGGDGDDILIGGKHKDKLFGGAGLDTFVFTSKKDSKKGGQRDKIQDFNRADDTIDLSEIDAKKGGGNQKFKWIGKHDFHGKKGELHYIDKGNKVIVQGDITGNGKADFEIFVKIGHLSAGDFDL